MSILPKLTAEDISVWLRIATRDLEPSAQARIRAEIEAHYAEAVRSHREIGFPEPAAQAASLAELGHAQAAAKRFRREHLTVKDVKNITSCIKAGRSTFMLAFGCLVLPVAAWTFRSDPNAHDLHTWVWGGVALILLVGLIAVAIGTFILARRKATPAIVRQVMLLDAIAWFDFYALVWVYAGGGLTAILNSVIFAGIFLKYFRLRKKLQSSRKDWSEMLPPDRRPPN